MMRVLNNEHGNGMLLTIFSFAIVCIMLVLLVNITTIFKDKQQASTAAEQASFAATSYLYERIYENVKDYVKVIDVDEDEGAIDIELLKPISEKIDEEERSLSNPLLSDNEKHIQAIDNVLEREIGSDEDFKALVTSAMSSLDLTNVISQTISDNKGKPADFNWDYEDFRIKVEAKTEFEAVHYNGINFGTDQEISQVGTGPEISFLQALEGYE
ncbi:pilus assembly protein TadG-related protein [Bacillus infantis]|uniref:pilus assembly protein TadG-related protein n=1 Tax=Bacillus infantis TaxID=324767 RepID=UPI0021551418|nr:pilus assembly protein TadG-related protein [Bacillus infantis]MCR6612465.1 pilus assembly protein TadG-related protein [Bacillus infantis]